MGYSWPDSDPVLPIFLSTILAWSFPSSEILGLVPLETVRKGFEVHPISAPNLREEQWESPMLSLRDQETELGPRKAVLRVTASLGLNPGPAHLTSMLLCSLPSYLSRVGLGFIAHSLLGSAPIHLLVASRALLDDCLLFKRCLPS